MEEKQKHIDIEFEINKNDFDKNYSFFAIDLNDESYNYEEDGLQLSKKELKKLYEKLKNILEED